eukprot:319915_1
MASLLDDIDVKRDAGSFHNDPFQKTTDWVAGYIPLYHQHLRNTIADQHKKLNRRINILDAGCAIGVFSAFLHNKLNKKKSICDIFGFDIQEDAIKQAQETMEGPTFKLVKPYQPLPFKSDFF